MFIFMSNFKAFASEMLFSKKNLTETLLDFMLIFFVPVAEILLNFCDMNSSPRHSKSDLSFPTSQLL